MKPIFLVDLDDTLFQTRHKIPAHLEPFRIAAEATNGRHSFYTEHQDALVAWMFSCADAIPVTARSRESFSRCSLPAHGRAVLSNGGLVLEADGSRDEVWHDRVRAESDLSAASMRAFLEAGAASEADVRSWIVEEEGVPLYACFKSNLSDTANLARIAARFRSVHPDLRFASNGNNLSATPSGISKAAAVRYLLEEKGLAAPGIPVFGMGDSLSDLPFMDLCHFKVVPTGSQVDALLTTGGSPVVAVSEAA